MKIINYDLQKLNLKKTCTAVSLISYPSHGKRYLINLNSSLLLFFITFSWRLDLQGSSPGTSRDLSNPYSNQVQLQQGTVHWSSGYLQVLTPSFSEQPGLVFDSPWVELWSFYVPIMFLCLVSFHCTSLRRVRYHLFYILGKYFLIWPGKSLTFFASRNHCWFIFSTRTSRYFSAKFLSNQFSLSPVCCTGLLYSRCMPLLNFLRFLPSHF